MKMIARVVFALLVICPLVNAYSEGSFKVVSLGQFHGEQVRVQNKERAFGLFLNQGHAELVPGIISVEPYHDEMIDIEIDQRSGKRVKFSANGKLYDGKGDESPLVILTGYGLRAGPLDFKAISKDQSSLDPGRSIELGNGMWLFATGIVKDLPGVPMVGIFDYALKLGQESRLPAGTPQKLWFTKQFDQTPGTNGVPHLLFAGDLNRDGAMDLIVSASNHYNVTNLHLFLSETASNGSKVLKKVAEFETSGC